MPATSGHDKSLSTLKDELGFIRSQSIGVKDLVQKLAELVEDDDHVTVDPAVKVFFLILHPNLLCPGPIVRLGRVAPMVENMDYAAMAQMDYCQLVVDEPQWKASGDIVYYCPPTGLCGSFDAGPSSHGVFCEPICSQLPTCDVEPPPTRGFKARRMFDTRSSSEQRFVGGKKHGEIDELLVKDSHEVKCAQYEKDAEHILEEMNRQDAGAVDDNAGVESAGIHASGDVGLGHPGVSSRDVHKDSYNGSQKDEDLADASSPPHVLVDKHEDADVDIEKPLENDVSVKDADVDIEKPLKNDVLVDSVAGFDVGLHGGYTSMFESEGSQEVMEDCAIQISPDKFGSFAGDVLNMYVASRPDGGNVAPAGSSCEMRRMTQLMKVVYSQKAYTIEKHPDWVKMAEKPNYLVVAEEGPNDFGLCSEPYVKDWKAEYIFQLLFNPLNLLYYGDMPAVLQDLIEILGLTSLSQLQLE
ncbi:hypothetical protein ZWY2020_014403 [Hordeum vulgare]|nr:hypothetical protein ZWY2020_014403 [Hordeum vulgare]